MKNRMAQVLDPRLTNLLSFHRGSIQKQAVVNEGMNPTAFPRNPKNLSELGSIPPRKEGENRAGMNDPGKIKNDRAASMARRLNGAPNDLKFLRSFFGGKGGQIYREMSGSGKNPNPMTAYSPKSILSITNIDIDLYKGGAKVQTIVSSQSNTGSYKWAPQGSLADGSDYRVRVFCSADSSVYGESSVFSIAPLHHCCPVIN